MLSRLGAEGAGGPQTTGGVAFGLRLLRNLPLRIAPLRSI